MMLTSKAFWAAAAERAVRTFAQSLAALLVADGTGLVDSRWLALLSVAGMAAVLSVLMSVASAGGTDGSPSLTGSEVLSTPGAAADPVGAEPVEVVSDYTPERGDA